MEKNLGQNLRRIQELCTFLPVSTRLLAGWWMHIHKSAVRPPRALARVPWWGWDVGVRASTHGSNLNPNFDQALCWVKFSVKSFSRKFSWNWWFHGKIFIFRILNLKQVQCFYLLFLPKTTGTTGSSTILSTSQISSSSEVEVNPSQWALPGGSLNKRTESSTKKIS